ncbi:MAG: DNA translocase FtsK [Candidatus Omnitrophota bacterium]|nr:DNA translocase FtsK [Candidatus Omnitrophota bacterium]
MKQQHLNEIRAIIIFGSCLIILASLVSYTPFDLPFYTSHPNVPAKNFIRIFGAYLAGALFFIIGWSAFFIVVFLLFWAWNKLKGQEIGFRFSKVASTIILFLVLSCLFGLSESRITNVRYERGGFLGFVIGDFLLKYFGRLGAYIILITLGILSLLLIGEFLISPLIFKVPNYFAGLVKLAKSILPKKREKTVSLMQKPAKLETPLLDTFTKRETKIEIRTKTQPIIKEAKPFLKEDLKEKEPRIVGEYHLPTLDLLDNPPPLSSRHIKEDLMSNAKILEETLGDFGVSVRVADIERGPVITRYELEPAPGVKVQRITTLSDDIALAMKAHSVRIVAPIPGKSRVGVEVPNSQSSIVYLKEVLSSDEFKTAGSKLTLALGKDIAGKPVVADLSEMPHLLIAGTTGSGKTVCVNSLIMSILFNSSPQEVKFLMVDPKMVELAPFNGLPHSLCPAVTDPKKVSLALNWVVNEMEQRYTLLAKLGVRNIEAYNAKQEKLPYIVVIIDELADLMAVAANHIENAITRLAQLSRAVGIHLILATQRPSVDVITGVIKANFPARISFKVASKVDSRTVLDMNGADKLLGHGDLLFLKPGDAKPIRAQGSLIQDKEIERVVEFIKNQQEPMYDEEIIKEQEKSSITQDLGKDELFDEAVKLILESNQASVSILQRRLRLGYTRAARLIDMMEQEGIIGSYRGSKPREILVDRESYLDSSKNG